MENNNASASDPEPKEGNEAPATRPLPVDTGKKVLNSAGVGQWIYVSLLDCLWFDPYDRVWNSSQKRGFSRK